MYYKSVSGKRNTMQQEKQQDIKLDLMQVKLKDLMKAKK